MSRRYKTYNNVHELMDYHKLNNIKPYKANESPAPGYKYHPVNLEHEYAHSLVRECLNKKKYNEAYDIAKLYDEKAVIEWYMDPYDNRQYQTLADNLYMIIRQHINPSGNAYQVKLK